MEYREDSYTKINVPADGSCLFWSTTFAFLSPVKYFEEQFCQRCTYLFGKPIDIDLLDKLRNLIETFEQTSDVQIIDKDNDFHLVNELIIYLRNRTVDYMKNDKTRFQNFITVDDVIATRNGEKFLAERKFLDQKLNNSGNDENDFKEYIFETYIECMRQPTSWAGNHEIQTLSELIESKICIFRDKNQNIISPNTATNEIVLFNVNSHYNYGLIKASLLIDALKNNRKEQSMNFIDFGIDNINIVDDTNSSALHYAVINSYFEIVAKLIKMKIKFHLKNNRNQTALDLAQLNPNNTKIIELIVSSQKRKRTNEEIETKKSLIPRPTAASHQNRIRLFDKNLINSKRSNVESKLNKFSGSYIPRRVEKRTISEQDSTPIQVNRLKVSILDKPEQYSASGLKHTLHGNAYQLKLLMLFLKRGLDKKYSFRLATEMDSAEKFDDLVFQYENSTKDGIIYQFLQAKHKQDESKTISLNDLLTETDGEFSLQKYFISYRKIRRNPEFQGRNSLLKDFIICTNIDLSVDVQNMFEAISISDDILKMDKTQKKSKYLQLKRENFPNEAKLITILKNTSDLYRLTKLLSEHLLLKKPLDLRSELFQIYHGGLAKEVLNINDVETRQEVNLKGKLVPKQYIKFQENFLRSQKEELQNFKDSFLVSYTNISKNQADEDAFWREMKYKEFQTTGNFGKTFELDKNPVITNLEEFTLTLTGLINNCDDQTVYIKRERGKSKTVIKDNIDKLAGHILVLPSNDQEKDIYCFSEKFFDKNCKLPGNLNQFRTGLNMKLSDSIELNKYKFHLANYQTCRDGQLPTRATLPNDPIADVDIINFFEQLIFAVNQPNEQELNHIIEQELGEIRDINLIDSDLIAGLFQREMFDWMKEKQGRFLTFKDGEQLFSAAKQRLAKLILIGPTLETRARIDQFGIRFQPDLAVHLKLDKMLTSKIRSKQIFNVISNNRELSMIKIYQSLKKYFKKDDSYIFVSLTTLTHLQSRILTAFSDKNSNLLIVECNAKDTDFSYFVKKLQGIIKLQLSKKVIFISSDEYNLLQKLQTNSTVYEEVRDTNNNLVDLTSESQEKILTDGKVTFQGIEMNINKIINEETKHLINPDILTKIITNKTFKIGSPLLNLIDIKYWYIDRLYHRNVRVRRDIFHEDSKFFIADSLDIDESMIQEDQDILFVSSDGCHFEDLCQKFHNRNIFWLKRHMVDLICKKSYGSIIKLRKFIDESQRKYKINFEFETFKNIEDKLVIISSEPGMGKSTLLTYLAEQVKDKDPSLWVLKIDLNNYTHDLNDANFKSLSLNTTIEFLENILKITTEIERELFRRSFYFENKLVLFFDGFDEISPEFEDKVLQLLGILKDTKLKQLWVSTRPHKKSIVEDVLNEFAYTLKPFSRDEQGLFLYKFWSKSLQNEIVFINEAKLNVYVEQLLNLVENSIHDTEKQFTGIPLQTKMLAEAFEKRVIAFQNLDIAYEPDLPKKFDLLSLYEEFIESKYEKYYLKEKKNFDKLKLRKEYKNLREIFMDEYKFLALSSIFTEKDVKMFLSKDKLKKLDEYQKEVSIGWDNVGLVDRIVNLRPIFVHQTFAEYFAALWFVDQISSENSKVCKLLKNVLFKEENEIIRNFVDRILAKDEELELHIAVLNNDIKKVGNILTTSKNAISSFDEAGRTGLHLCASYGCAELAIVLIKNGADINASDVVFNWRPISYADQMKHWNVIDVLLKNGADGKDMYEINKNVNWIVSERSEETVLHICATNNYVLLAQYLIDKNADIDKQNFYKESPLHLASKVGYLESVKLLTKNGANTKIKDRFRYTPLQVAAVNNHLSVVKYYIEDLKVAITDHYDDDDNTFLHFLAGHDCLDVVKYFITIRGDLNVVNKINLYGSTPLHYAAGAGQLDTVKYLIANNADYFAVDDSTPITSAALNGRLEVVKYFIEELKIDVNAAEYDGSTPLHLATRNGHLNCVRYLVDEQGADMSLLDNYKKTPLHWAVGNTHLHIVKYFLEEKQMDFSSVELGNCDNLLQLAARNGMINVFKYLINSYSFDMEYQNKNGDTFLHLIVKDSDFATIVDLVEEKKVSLLVLNFEGNTAVHEAARISINEHTVNYLLNAFKQKHPNEFNKLLYSTENMTPYLYAILNGRSENADVIFNVMKENLELFKKTLEDDVDLNDPTAVSEIYVKNCVKRCVQNNYHSILHEAISGKNIDMVRLILNEIDPSKINIPDYLGNTPLMCAARSDQVDTARVLLNFGAKIDLQNDAGETALTLTADNVSCEEVTRVLLEFGADMNIRNKRNLTALGLAVQEYLWDVAVVLLENGGNIEDIDPSSIEYLVDYLLKINTEIDGDIVKSLLSKYNWDKFNNDGWSLIHRAVEADNVNIIKGVLHHDQSHINIYTRNDVRNTPLHVAAIYDHCDSAKFLLENGAKIDLVNSRDETPIDLARKYNSSNVVLLFEQDKRRTIDVSGFS